MSTPSPRQGTAAATCPTCARPFVRTGRQLYCSDSCRQRAWRRRHPQPDLTPLSSPPATPTPVPTVYECPSCEVRLLGQQRCLDCHLWARRLGPGGLCPHCDEPVTLADLGLSPAQGGAMP
jgi:hypothetical protein